MTSKHERVSDMTSNSEARKRHDDKVTQTVSKRGLFKPGMTVRYIDHTEPEWLPSVEQFERFVNGK